MQARVGGSVTRSLSTRSTASVPHGVLRANPLLNPNSPIVSVDSKHIKFHIRRINASTGAILKGSSKDIDGDEYFRSQPLSYWRDSANLRRFLKYLADKEGISKPEDWYRISSQLVTQRVGRGPIRLHGSFPRIMALAHPDLKLLPWKFIHAKLSWDDFSLQRAYMKWLSGELKKEEGKPEQWYAVTKSDFKTHFGGGLLLFYNNSPYQLLSTIYSDTEWLPWKFAKTPKGYWADKTNQRAYLEWLAKRLGYTDMDDWYKVKSQDFIANFGSGLLASFNNSPVALLNSAFPDHPFHPWNFSTASDNVWKDDKQMKEVLQHIQVLLKIKSKEDWLRVSPAQITKLGFENMFRQAGGLAAVVKRYIS